MGLSHGKAQAGFTMLVNMHMSLCCKGGEAKRERQKGNQNNIKRLPKSYQKGEATKQ